MQSFAKAAAKPKKATAPKAAVTSAVEDTSMQALSDDGEDDFVAMPEPKEENEATRKSRKERQEELKRMMEESSEDEEPEKEDTPMEEAGEEPAAPEPEEKADAEPAEVVSSTGDGRRRGKRRVKKKKTVMDEQGYLGTSCLHCLKFEAVLIRLQSPSWKTGTSLSPKTNPRPPQRRRKSRHNLRSRRRRRRRDRATSCPSSARSSRCAAACLAWYLGAAGESGCRCRVAKMGKTRPSSRVKSQTQHEMWLDRCRLRQEQCGAFADVIRVYPPVSMGVQRPVCLDTRP